jgi:hypothetical protein
MSSVLTVANWSEFRMASFKNSTSRCPSLQDNICGSTESSCNIIAIRRNPSSRDSRSSEAFSTYPSLKQHSTDSPGMTSTRLLSPPSDSTLPVSTFCTTHLKKTPSPGDNYVHPVGVACHRGVRNTPVSQGAVRPRESDLERVRL